MKLHTHTCGKKDEVFDDITDETIWKLQEMGIKFIEQKNPINSSGSMIRFANRSGSTTRQSPEVMCSPQQTQARTRKE